jgi:uncharacterized membrane protein (DUF485 family)
MALVRVLRRSPLLFRFAIGAPTLLASFVAWAIAIGWMQNLAEMMAGSPVVDASDEWHWLALVGLLILPFITTLVIVRRAERRFPKPVDS